MYNLLVDGITQQVVLQTEQTRKLTIDGITKPYRVYKIRLDKLFYNDQNDRIATWLCKYKADNHLNSIDMDDIEAYNDIIQNFIIESNKDAIKNTQNNIELVDQREPGVVLADGRIIDGNRRFTCLRNLSVKDPKFNWFEAVILEHTLENSAKQIKMLELMIQHGEESKVDYNPIDKLVGIYNDVIDTKLLTAEEYQRSTTESMSEVKKEIELANLLVEYLEFINAPKQFYIARDMDLNGPLNELYGVLSKCKDDEKRESLKNSAFTNFLLQPSSDMTRFIRKFKSVSKSDCLDDFLDEQEKITTKVLEALPESGKVTNKSIGNLRETQRSSINTLNRTLEKYEAKANIQETRSKPAEQLEKASDILGNIDVGIFTKLKSEELEAVSERIDQVQSRLDKIKGALNV